MTAASHNNSILHLAGLHCAPATRYNYKKTPGKNWWVNWAEKWRLGVWGRAFVMSRNLIIKTRQRDRCLLKVVKITAICPQNYPSQPIPHLSSSDPTCCRCRASYKSYQWIVDFIKYDCFYLFIKGCNIVTDPVSSLKLSARCRCKNDGFKNVFPLEWNMCICIFCPKVNWLRFWS